VIQSAAEGIGQSEVRAGGFDDVVFDGLDGPDEVSPTPPPAGTAGRDPFVEDDPESTVEDPGSDDGDVDSDAGDPASDADDPDSDESSPPRDPDLTAACRSFLAQPEPL
jgi:hypothetical protein